MSKNTKKKKALQRLIMSANTFRYTENQKYYFKTKLPCNSPPKTVSCTSTPYTRLEIMINPDIAPTGDETHSISSTMCCVSSGS